jgi:hypothetical protein
MVRTLFSGRGYKLCPGLEFFRGQSTAVEIVTREAVSLSVEGGARSLFWEHVKTGV